MRKHTFKLGTGIWVTSNQNSNFADLTQISDPVYWKRRINFHYFPQDCAFASFSFQNILDLTSVERAERDKNNLNSLHTPTPPTRPLPDALCLSKIRTWLPKAGAERTRWPNKKPKFKGYLVPGSHRLLTKDSEGARIITVPVPIHKILLQNYEEDVILNFSGRANQSTYDDFCHDTISERFQVF